MNIQKYVQRKKRAISPVLATVILIAITLVAAVAIAGFVFGLFGSFQNQANIRVSSSQIAATDNTGTICAINFVNSGTSGGTVQSINLQWGGNTTAVDNSPSTFPFTVPADNLVHSFDCTNWGTSPSPLTGSTSGQTYTLQVVTSNGQASGSGSFQ